jgi:hypothetical protein
MVVRGSHSTAHSLRTLGEGGVVIRGSRIPETAVPQGGAPVVSLVTQLMRVLRNSRILVYPPALMIKAESLKAQDILTACKLYAYEAAGLEMTYAGLGRDVGLATSEAHASVERCRRASLLTASNIVCRRNLRELLVVAVPYVYYPTRGGLEHGMLTSVHAPPLASKIAQRVPSVIPVVWPGRGRDRGESLTPIYSTVPQACATDVVLYEIMALVEVLRVGSALEKAAAAKVVDELMAGRRGCRSADKVAERSA